MIRQVTNTQEQVTPIDPEQVEVLQACGGWMIVSKTADGRHYRMAIGERNGLYWEVESSRGDRIIDGWIDAGGWRWK